MSAGNTNNCGCENSGRVVELQQSAQPIAYIIDDDCGCEHIVRLYTDHDPDVLLFDEYAEQHLLDIAQIKENTDTLLTKTDTIITKENSILGDTATIKNTLTQGVTSIRGDIAAEAAAIKSKVDTKAAAIQSDVANAKTAIQGDVATSKTSIMGAITNGVNTILNAIHGAIALEEATEEDIDNLFNEE